MAGTRRSRPLLAAATALIALVAGFIGGDQPARAGVSAGPNVIVIMSDDQAPGMMKALPTVRRELGARGTTFANAFATYPLCCPARATLLTGEYAHNHGTLGNNRASGGGYQALLDPERNLAAWLQASGYATGFAGKWLNGLRTPRRPPPGWDQWSALVGEGGDGLSSYYDYDLFEADATPAHYGSATADYQTDVLTRDYAVPFIQAQAVDPRPFFLWLAYHPPHFGLGRPDAAGRRCSQGPPTERASKQSAIPPARYARLYRHAAVPRPPSFDERDVSDKPKLVRRHPPLAQSELATIASDYRCGLAALRALDDGVGEIVAGLRATGQLSNTVLVFLADQGVMSGEHRIKRGKNIPYEEAIKIPLLIRGPSIAAGREIAEPVSNADLAPTILNLAGATIPPELARPIDGVSQAPTLAGAAPPPGRVVPIEGRDSVSGSHRGYKVRSYVGVRTSRYAYFEYRRANFDSRSAGANAEIGAGRTTESELYDLARDPYELRNRARDPVYGPARSALARLTAELEHCSGAVCVVTANPPLPR